MPRIALFALILLFQGLLSARTISWAEAVELAKNHSPELKSAFENYKAALAAEQAAFSGFFPKVSANLRGTESGSTLNSSQFSYGADLSLTQNLFSGFSDFYGYKIKKNTALIAKAELKIVQARISQELVQTFAETYFTQENKKLTQTILNRREENFKSVQLQYEVGRENKGSLLLAQSYVEQARYDLLRAENEADTTLENLRRYLGLASGEEIDIENNISKESAPKTMPNFSELAEINPILQKAQIEKDSAEFYYKQSRSEFFPSLNFNASYGYSDAVFFPKNDSWSLGLILSIPLFDGFADRAAYRANFYKSLSSASSFQTSRLTLIRDLKKTYYDFIESIQKEKVDISFNRAANLRGDIARSKYKNGLLSFEDWDLIESDLIVKQKEIIQSEKNRIIKQSQWQKIQGIGVFE
jgi:outer membrane protein